MPLSLIVHGGAWDIPEELVEAHESGCRAALLEGWSTLQTGGHQEDGGQPVSQRWDGFGSQL